MAVVASTLLKSHTTAIKRDAYTLIWTLFANHIFFIVTYSFVFILLFARVIISHSEGC